MVFNSFLFLLIFLPITLIGWFGLNRIHRKAADLFLIGMSLWFYGSFRIGYLPVLALSIGMNYLIGLQTAKQKKFFFILGIICNLILLVLFKYVTPGLSDLSDTANAAEKALVEIGLPTGLSFYTFSQISYLADLWRGESTQEGFLPYLVYITYFPKIAEGPITQYEEIASQFRDDNRRKPDPENIIRGLILLFLGMGKKLLIADSLALAASFGFESAYYLDTLSVLLTMSCYALQLYFDFSGFCDMAMGVSQMMNIELPLNFDAPYRALTFSDFWKRWHMTLTRFFTHYVYIPLGGSRKGTFRTCCNIMIVFLLSALWHGIEGTYLVWGILSGVLVILSRFFFQEKIRKAAEKGRKLVFRGVTFALFAFTLVFFGSPDLAHSIAILRNLFRPLYPGWLYHLGGQLDMAEFWLLNKVIQRAVPDFLNLIMLLELLLVLVIAMRLAFGRKTAFRYAETMNLSRKNAVRMGILMVWCLVSMSGVTTYLYFQF